MLLKYFSFIKFYVYSIYIILFMIKYNIINIIFFIDDEFHLYKIINTYLL